MHTSYCCDSNATQRLNRTRGNQPTDHIGIDFCRVMLVALVVLSTACLESVQAALLLNASGDVVQVTDVESEGRLFDVSFHVGSYDSAYGSELDPIPLPTFDGNEIGANLVLASIAEQFNGAGIGLIADSVSGTTADIVLVPYSHDATRFNARTLGYRLPNPTWDILGLRTGRDNSDLSGPRLMGFTYFTQTGFIPEPSTLLLAVLGMVFIGATRTRSATSPLIYCGPRILPFTDCRRFHRPPLVRM